ncbi:hypothetical protein SAY86_015652 [Trapa natans]|uniref:Uncharacterized protein n=1 Tax=Trapa natans TaxID=22666 RepID=A0AAN7QZ55_TRANT|nr:hypothetical protein SAY86_015652 [Trapa natans]
MIIDEMTANAVGGRTARACESCLRRRARWYCTADDAFLCAGCDASVHSANQLARRHERVRLEVAPPPLPTSSVKSHRRPVRSLSGDDSVTVPAWHGGFTRKARTPRKKGLGADGGLITKLPSPGDHVPELSGEFDVSTASIDDSDDFQCLVPVFDSFAEEGDCDLIGVGGGEAGGLDMGLLLPSEVDLEEFAVDMESLLEEVGKDDEVRTGEVKVKDELLEKDNMLDDDDDSDMSVLRNLGVGGGWDEGAEVAADWDLEYRMPFGAAEAGRGDEFQEEKPAVMVAARDQTDNLGGGSNSEGKQRKMLLRLNYEDVITAWVSHRSPWTSGCRPDFWPDHGWPKCTGSYASDVHDQQSYGDQVGLRGHPLAGDDKGREARVSRYREKRRTRMFSKKIRYQVRKLNAEKRPRMKGRFVKRTPPFA